MDACQQAVIVTVHFGNGAAGHHSLRVLYDTLGLRQYSW
jgi:hypothetical protein